MSNNKEIISALKEKYEEFKFTYDQDKLKDISYNYLYDSYIHDITGFRYGKYIVDYYSIDWKTNIGTFNIYQTYRGHITKRAKGLFVKANVPYSLGKIFISNSQSITLEDIKKRFIPNYSNIPITLAKVGNASKILNDNIQRIISDFSAKNKSIGIIFEDNSIFICAFCKYISKKEKSQDYYESVVEEVDELLNTLNQILRELEIIYNYI